MATNQKMLQVDKTDASKGPVAGGSRSDTSRLAKAYPGGPQYVTTPKKIVSMDGCVNQKDIEMSPAEYRDAYKAACMVGETSTVHEFDKSIDMSYGTTNTAEPSPPNLLFLSPPGFPSKESTHYESTQGYAGSTISASGRGPNVNPILTLEGIPKPDSERAIADPKPDLLPTSDSPSAAIPSLPEGLLTDDLGVSSYESGD